MEVEFWSGLRKSTIGYEKYPFGLKKKKGAGIEIQPRVKSNIL
jgi:hypothetical protein